MEDSEIKGKFALFENEINGLRKKSHDLSNKMQSMVAVNILEKEVDRLRDIVDDAVPEIASMRVYVDRIDRFEEIFDSVFRGINGIKESVNIRFTQAERREFRGRIAIYAQLIGLLAMAVGLLWKG